MAQSNQILERYLSTLEKDPSSRVFAPLAEYYRKNGLLTQAIDTLSQGIKLNPEYVLGHLGLAFCYYDNGDVRRAYEILNPLVDSNRDNIRMLKLFSDICLDLKKNEQALEYLKYLLFINPKDTDAATKVTLLEKESEKFGPIKFNVQDEISEEQTEILFDLESMKSSPEKVSQVDEWVKLDLKQEEESSDDIGEWSMSNEVDLPKEKEQEEVREFKVNRDVKTASESPVITHTLVDLYCNQGYLDKAKDLLEKILELNPNDLKTKLKLQEVERVLSEAYIDDIETHEDNEESESISLLQNDDQNEDSGRSELMNLFDKTFKEDSSKSTKLEIVEAPSKVDENNKLNLIENKLWAFHKSLTKRANQVLSN
jgi:pentatricopeptide repeat protein